MHNKCKLHNFIHLNEEIVVAIKSNTLTHNYQTALTHVFTHYTSGLPVCFSQFLQCRGFNKWIIVKG